MDVIITSTNEVGQPTAGWHRVRTRQLPAFVDTLIDDGLAARAAMAVTDPRRQQISAWIDTLNRDAHLAPRDYPMRGKAVTHVEPFTAAAGVAAQQRAHLIDAQARRARVKRPETEATCTTIAAARKALAPTRSSTPQSLATAIAKARKALAA